MRPSTKFLNCYILNCTNLIFHVQVSHICICMSHVSTFVIILFHRFEQRLREINPSLAIPYWDSTLDQGLPEPRDSILWTDDFLGNNDGPVTSGPFAYWPVIRKYFNISIVHLLYINCTPNCTPIVH